MKILLKAPMLAVLIGYAGAAIAAPPAAAGQAASGIVTIDGQRILAECTACKAANAQLQQQGSQLQAYVQQQQAVLNPEAQQLEAQQKALNGKQPDAAFQTRAQAFIAKRTGIEQQAQQRQEAIQRNANYVRQQIGAKLQPIVFSVMTAHHAAVALDLSATVSVAPSTDVTNEVLAQLNAQLPSVTVAAPAAPAAAAGGDGR